MAWSVSAPERGIYATRLLVFRSRPGPAQHSPRIICNSSGMLHWAVLRTCHQSVKKASEGGVMEASISPGKMVGLFNMPILPRMFSPIQDWPVTLKGLSPDNVSTSGGPSSRSLGSGRSLGPTICRPFKCWASVLPCCSWCICFHRAERLGVVVVPCRLCT